MITSFQLIIQEFMIKKGMKCEKMNVNEKSREGRLSNYELLRCICIFQIILFHCIYKSSIDLQTFSINIYLIEVLYLFGKVGANTFILISGYFFDNTKFSWRKVLNLWLLIQFYTILSIGVKAFVFHESFKINGIKELIRLLFPLTFGKYWFVSAYVLIYIFSPYIKVWALSLSKKDFIKMICLFIGIWSIWGTIMVS